MLQPSGTEVVGEGEKEKTTICVSLDAFER